MNLAKKLAKVFSLIFLAVSVASCDKGCVQSDEFDNEITTINSNPVQDGIQGNYPNQVAGWHDTGLKLNGEKIVLQVSGAWTPWYGDDDSGSDTALRNAPACGFGNTGTAAALNFCAKNATSPNCICYLNQTPAVERDYSDQAISCSDSANQNDPNKCSCTQQYGAATDYGVYHFPLSQVDKNQVPKVPDDQVPCKYTKGMGLYLGVFGNSGNVSPLRAYHLFSEVEICNVRRDVNNKCLDDSGRDVTQYIFTSANDRTFVKDDNIGNTGGIDNNPGGDTLHARNEVMKLIILDNYYNDNYGTYQVQFMSGIGKDRNPGLIEYFVRLIEDSVMGKVDADGARRGGIIETMFNSIVRDSGFISVLQMALSIYIAFYGLAVLMGLAEISKKELMSRALKVGLIIFFTSETSWYFYNKIVVGFFKDGMDYVISIFMDLSDRSIDPTSAIVSAQMDRAASISNATRFSYVDHIIEKLLSVATAKKIFGLFFGVPLFGIIYIPIIYLLIGSFIYVMLTVGMIYVVAITQLAFVLAMGPIFIAFTLSSHTNDMFKKWLAFVGARSLEIIFLFLILYNFLVLIDQNFTSLLSYKTCFKTEALGGFIVFPTLVAEVNRSLVAWFSAFIMLGGLIYITKLIIDKIPELAGALITIGGQGSTTGAAQTEFVKSMAGSIAGGLMGGVSGAASTLGDSLGGLAAAGFAKTMQGATEVARSAKSAVLGGVTDVMGKTSAGTAAMNTAGKVWSMLPSSPRAMYRNSIIDAAISKAKTEAVAGGKTGKELDSAIRAAVVQAMQTPTASSKFSTLNANPGVAALAGMDIKTITDRMNQKLVNEPLRDFIKAEAQKMKDSPTPLVGKEFRTELKKRANDWADKNIAGGKESIKGIMSDRGTVVDGFSASLSGGVGVSFNNMKEFIRDQSEYSADQAAKAFASNPAGQQAYLQHLQENKFERERARKEVSDKAWIKPLNQSLNYAYDKVTGAINAVKPFDDMSGRDSMRDPTRAETNFLRKVRNQEVKDGSIGNYLRRKTGSWLERDQGSALNPLNLFKSSRAIDQTVREGERSGLVNYLSKGGAEKEISRITESYAKRIADAPNWAAKKALENKRDEKLGVFNRDPSKKDAPLNKRGFFKDQLRNVALKLALKNAGEIATDLKEITAREEVVNQLRLEQAANLLKGKTQEEKFQEREKEIAAMTDGMQKSAKLSQLKMDRSIAGPATNEKTRAEENERIEKLKKDEWAKIAGLKTNVQSLEDIAREIKDLKNGTAAGSSKSAEQIREDRTRGEDLEAAVGKQIRLEYEAALAAHVKEQQQFLNAAAQQLLEDAAKNLTGQKLFDEMARIMDAPLAGLKDDARLKVLGGADALKEGLSEIGGTTLFEKAARLQYYEDQFGSKGSGSSHVGSSAGAGVSNAGSSSGPGVSSVGSSAGLGSSSISASTASPSVGEPAVFARSSANRDFFFERVAKGEGFISLAGLDADANEQEATRAFRKLALKYHPDKNKDQPLATEVFKEINASYMRYRDALNKKSDVEQSSLAQPSASQASQPQPSTLQPSQPQPSQPQASLANDSNIGAEVANAADRFLAITDKEFEAKSAAVAAQVRDGTSAPEVILQEISAVEKSLKEKEQRDDKLSKEAAEKEAKDGEGKTGKDKDGDDKKDKEAKDKEAKDKAAKDKEGQEVEKNRKVNDASSKLSNAQNGLSLAKMKQVVLAEALAKATQELTSKVGDKTKEEAAVKNLEDSLNAATSAVAGCESQVSDASSALLSALQS